MVSPSITTDSKVVMGRPTWLTMAALDAVESRRPT
jgi:hypothetical protein